MDNKFVTISERRVVVAQLGARRGYAVARGLAASGCLELMVTDACALNQPWSYVDRVLPQVLRRGVIRGVLDRRPLGLNRNQISGSLSTLAFQLFGTLSQTRAPKVRFWVNQNKRFGRAACRSDWGRANTLYAFNGAGVEVFERARKLGLGCVLDQTAAPWRYNTTLLREEQRRWPGWEISPADVDVDGEMVAREEAEWKLADRIVCGSQFVMNAIREVGGPAEKCVVVPYPVVTRMAPRDYSKERSGRLRVLFAGTLQLRKGIQYVWDAAARLSGAVEFRAIGPSNLTASAERMVRSHVDWRGAVPRSNVWEHYRWADVFLLPTLSEGSANVCWEALSTGLPVLTTRAAGVENGAQLISASADNILHALTSPGWTVGASKVTLPSRSIADYGTDLLAAMS